ncbi:MULTISPECIES: Npun_F0494 family protein [Nostocales]|uniref:Uncharacterized protein n=3 Tax=Nostocales TaxID=1161 RepID=A0A0C1QR73_9CYAN|nr:Npun_F0494 family protein [Tolypothrix bouteillei]KAF3888492.1 hypothetical protein DA73_0400025705 [Tolypothrix bouteillei VB521301]
MSVTNSPSPKIFTYPRKTIERAERALVCSPFQLNLFETMLSRSVALSEITGSTGVQKGFTKRLASELSADNDLVWLIQVGVLRREVDGQGITDSFRLTPLGRQLVKQCHQTPWRAPSWSDRLYDTAIRWLKLPL